MKIFLVGGLIALGAALFFLFFSYYQVIRYSQARTLLGSFIQIHICATRAEKDHVLHAFDKAWKRLEEIHARMNVYSDKSDIAVINQSYPKALKVHEDVYQLLALSKKYSTLTRGAFDVTIWPLVLAWKKAQEKQQLPSLQEIKRAQEAMGSDKIKLLDNSRVQLTHPQTKIDLSAIGQGYAADEVAILLKQENIKHFLVDAGGEVFAQGKNERGSPWRIGVRDPRQEGAMVDIVGIDHQGVSTSGDYEKYYMIGQKKYSHIINPKTGYPGPHVISTTVIAPNATQADVFSTALCVLGKEGMGLVESLSPEAAVMLMEQHPDQTISIYKNSNYQRMTR